MKAIIAVNNLSFIGFKGGLPWDCKEDLRNFADLTRGQTLLVGRRTYDTLPPLKGRKIIVDTDSTSVKKIDWCIGGKKTYEKYCHLFTELHISYIDDDTIGDTCFPDLSNLNPNCKIIKYYY